MSKYDQQFKLTVVKAYLAGVAGSKSLAKRYGVDHGAVRRWVRAYKALGAAGIEPKTYTHRSAHFKLKVLKRMWKDDLSCRGAAALFDIRSAASISTWERLYHEGGIEALEPRKRGRPARMQQPPSPPPDLPNDGTSRAPKELLDELRYLRAENAYLKKLQDLVLVGSETAPGNECK